MLWYNAIGPYYSSNLDVMACPTFKGEWKAERAIIWMFGNPYFRPPQNGSVCGLSYGFNGYGLASTSTVYPDGADGLGLGPSQPAAGGLAPVRPDLVKNPTEMIAIADSLQMIQWHYIYGFILAVGDGEKPPVERHNGGSNVAFADGHAVNMPIDRLLQDSDASRRRWNKDNKPHFEIVLP